MNGHLRRIVRRRFLAGWRSIDIAKLAGLDIQVVEDVIAGTDWHRFKDRLYDSHIPLPLPSEIYGCWMGGHRSEAA